MRSARTAPARRPMARLVFFCLFLSLASLAQAQPLQRAVSQVRLSDDRPVRADEGRSLSVRFAVRGDLDPARVRVYLASALPQAFARATRSSADVRMTEPEAAGAGDRAARVPYRIAAEQDAARVGSAWEAELTIPEGSAAGDWYVLVGVEDGRGHERLFPTGQTIALSSPSATPPTLGTTVTLTPSTIDISAADGVVTADVQLLDADGVTSAMFLLDEENSGSSAIAFATLASGTAQNGVWRGEFTLPRYSATGSWKLTVFASDATGSFGLLETGRSLTVTGTGDTQAPTLAGIATVTPAQVTLEEGPATITVSVPLQDNLSGVEAASLYFENGDEQIYGSLDLASGSAKNGVWEGEVDVPQNTPAGSYQLFVYVYDIAGNFAELSTSATLQVGGGDVQAPVIAGAVTVTPSTVDLSKGEAEVTVRIPMRDVESGVEYLYGYFQLDDTDDLFAYDTELISGDSLDGVWELTFHVPANTEPGAWALHVYAYDYAGNTLDLENVATLNVSGGDVAGPQLAGTPTLSRSAVDLLQDPQQVQVDVPLEDDGGVRFVGVSFRNGQDAPIGNATAVLVSGDTLSGVWRATVLIQQRTADGTYHLVVETSDNAGNYSTLQTASTLTVTGGDETPAELAGPATITPTTLDLTPGDGAVTATVPLRDARSGVESVALDLKSLDGAVIASGNATRISGDANEGVWEARLTVRQDRPVGTYTLHARVWDRADNYESLATTATVNLVINLPGTVSNPIPAAGATNVPERPQLAWQPAEAATSYDVYLWSAADPMPQTPTAAGLTLPRYVTSDTLVAGQAYNWRVVARNPAGSTAGPVWSFTVRHLPDLIVSDVDVPPTAEAGQIFEIQWTVTNAGGAGTNVPNWIDEVYLSTDDKFDPPLSGGGGTAGDVKLAAAQNVSYLGGGESYIGKATVTLPRRQFGPLYLIVVADAGRFPAQIESDETNNAGNGAVQVTLPPPPDLQVTALIAPPTVFAGQEFDVQWTITNRGTGSTYNAAWDEMLYLTRDSVLNIDRPLFKQRYRHIHNLKPDSAYTGVVSVTLPDTVSGKVFAHLVVDAYDYEFEPGGETNNYAQTALTSILSPPADLVVTAVQGPQNAASGETVNVSWTVTNEGAGKTNAWWSDRVYMSATPTFDPATAVVLGAFSNKELLEVDGFYTNTQPVRVPDGRSGTQYFFVEADWQNRVFEQAFEGNNVGGATRGTQVTLSPWADLEAVSVTAPPAATAGETISLVWNVRNIGVAAARPQWRDSLFVSTASTWDPAAATFVGLAFRTDSVRAGASYTQSIPVTLPPNQSGTLYLYAVVDAGNAVYEHTGEGNNVVRSGAITVGPYPPVDLAVGAISAPTQAASGDPVIVSWNVENLGTGATLGRRWFDQLYLSTTDSLTASARFLTDLERAQPVAGGDQYARSFTVKIPDDLPSGQYYLIASNTFGQNGADINLRNNWRASAAVQVTATPPPDLRVTAIAPPQTLVAGQPVTLEWTVKNDATGAVRDTIWHDAVYLSRNANLGDGTIRLGTATRIGALAAGAQFTQTLQTTLPYFATGTYYLVIVADEGSRIYEAERDDNNRQLIPVEILLPAPSDLVVTDVRVPATGIVGEDVTVTWKLENRGINTASGRTTTGVYFSSDATWSIDDALLVLDERDLNLAPGQQAEFSGKVDLSSRLQMDSLGVVSKLPGLSPGTYHALVRADLRNNIRETNDANNAAASDAKATVTVPALALGTPVTRDFDFKNNHYFRIDVAAGLDLRLTLSRNAAALPGGVYVAFNRVPTPSDYDYANARVDEQVRQVVVPSTQAGTYYVLVRGEIIYFEEENFTLLGEAMGFTADAVQPRRVGQGVVTTKLTGAGFRPTSRVVLRSGNVQIAEADVVQVPSTTEMTVRWDLSAVPVGSYRLFVLNQDGAEAEAGESFEVEPVVTPRLELVRSAPNALLVNRRTDYVFQFRNVGNIDLPYASIMLSVPAGTGVTLTTNGRLMSQRELRANAGLADASAPVYVDGSQARFIPLVARDVAPGEPLEAKLAVHPTDAGGGLDFPIRAYAQIQDKATFLTGHLQKVEELRSTVLANPGAVHPTYVALAQNPADFAAFLLDGLVQMGLIEAGDVQDAIELLPAVAQQMQAAPVRTVPDFTAGSAYGLVQPSMALTCEDVFFYTGCLAAALDCLPELAVVPLSAGASAALCVFGLTTGCTSALDVASNATGADLSLAGCLGLASALNCFMKEVICNNLLFSLDPNDIIGPDGYGDARWVARSQALPYTIRFENDPEKATAPAQEVRITLPLDEDFDVRSFRLGKFGFGSFAFDVPENTAFYTTRLDVRDSLGIYVDVSAGLDIEARRAFWTLRSIDPATGTLPNDPFAGFLAINDSLGHGQGFVSYTVRPNPAAKTGDRVEAQASIVFDLNAPIDTPPVFNTVDAVAPTSRIQALAGPPEDGRIALSWTAQDDLGGTGVRTYALYVAEGDGPYRPHASDLTDTRYVYPGTPGTAYRFFVLATDHAGNTEALKSEPDVVVTRADTPDELPTAFTLDQNFPNPFSHTTTLRFALPEAATVTLEVFNVVGQRVAVMIEDEVKTPGWHTASFDGSELASGVYFYRIRTSESGGSRHVQTGKMVLVR